MKFDIAANMYICLFVTIEWQDDITYAEMIISFHNRAHSSPITPLILKRLILDLP